jgi:hypothetical protein
VRYPVDEFQNREHQTEGQQNKGDQRLDGTNQPHQPKKKEYSNKITNTKNQLNNEINQLENESFNIQTSAFDVRNKYFKEKINTNNLFCKTKQFQDGSKMIEDFENKKFKPKSKNALNEEFNKVQNENEQLLETLRNFKDTHNEMGVIIEEVMKI